MEQGAQPSFAVARILASALAAGVFLFWVVAWLLTAGGRKGIAPDALSPTLALWVWAGVAMAGFGAAMAFHARAVAQGRAHRPADEGGAGGAAVPSNLIVAWALLEGPALMGGIFFLLTGAVQLLLFAAPLYLIGVLVTFPRRAWFETSRSRSGVG